MSLCNTQTPLHLVILLLDLLSVSWLPLEIRIKCCSCGVLHKVPIKTYMTFLWSQRMWSFPLYLKATPSSMPSYLTSFCLNQPIFCLFIIPLPFPPFLYPDSFPAHKYSGKLFTKTLLFLPPRLTSRAHFLLLLLLLSHFSRVRLCATP